ncbi:MAG TPA: hypothetical protein DCL96_09360 [Prevotella sp.]|jgi:hypothetical protein|nr:hypothetical protein [Prevotella sp.]
MKTITIKIIKKSVMGVVEGLTATIAQHNSDVDFQSVWASDAEEARLDIYYREAITDLENFLARFSSSTTQKFDLQALADDFSITIVTLAAWPPRLSGVLSNQIQNYLVHAIIAGWLSDFPEMAHTDYAGMGASDLDAIKEILLKKDFNFAEAERKADDTTKEGSSASDTSARAVDGDEKAGSSPIASARSGDEIGKQKNAQAPSGRSVDTGEKDNGELAVQSRSVDAEAKSQNELDAEARNVDEVDKDGQSGPKGSERNQDFVSQHFHQDRVDWSGGRPPYELR